MICPKNAPDYNAPPLSDQQAAEWCRSAYSNTSARCARCEDRKRWGVGKVEKVETKVEQRGGCGDEDRNRNIRTRYEKLP